VSELPPFIGHVLLHGRNTEDQASRTGLPGS
jgi:hypothetical protein